jgi:hypothetical protein
VPPGDEDGDRHDERDGEQATKVDAESRHSDSVQGAALRV